MKAKREPEYRFYSLYDKVCREDVLLHAYRLCRENRGAEGVDGVTFEAIEASGRAEWLSALRKELVEKMYRPKPVRRVMIPKPGGGERPLGIPCIRDRVVQAAAKLILEPIFEADFEPTAFGYRPRRSALDAIQKTHRVLCDGFREVVDADLSKYFDSIPHDELMRFVARRVVDGPMLKLVKLWLKAPVEERDDRGRRILTGGRRSRRGTPQGGVLSPLLANIYMNRFLQAWRLEGKGEEFRAHLVNYADDFVILSRGKAAQALAWTRQTMESLGLQLNETKTCVRDTDRGGERFVFLGYELGLDVYTRTGRLYQAAKPAKKSIQRLKLAVREWLGPGNQLPWPEVATRLNQILRGWANYFGYGTRQPAYRAIDRYVDERVRHFLRRRHKVHSQGTQQFPTSRIFGELGVFELRKLLRAASPS